MRATLLLLLLAVSVVTGCGGAREGQSANLSDREAAREFTMAIDGFVAEAGAVLDEEHTGGPAFRRLVRACPAVPPGDPDQDLIWSNTYFAGEEIAFLNTMARLAPRYQDLSTELAGIPTGNANLAVIADAIDTFARES